MSPRPPLLLLLLAGCSLAYRDSALQLRQALQRLNSDEIRLPQIQEHFYEQHIEVDDMNGTEVLQTLVGKIGNTFNLMFRAVTELRDELETLYATGGFNGTWPYTECCELPEDEAEFDPFYNARVSRTTCVRFAPGSQSALVPTHPDLVKRMTLVGDYSGVAWLYYGTEFGTFIKFPSNRASSCDIYDPRLRPWYVETATPPKDLVLTIDVSDSMRGDKLELAKRAVSTLLATLNPTDRVALVVFSNEALTPPGDANERCYSQDLAFATQQVTRYLDRYVQHIEALGLANYTHAITQAFQFFERDQLQEETHRQKGVLLLTDGDSRHRDLVLNTLAQRNALQRNEVAVLVYNVGTDMEGEAARLLRDMANMTVYNATAGPRRVGLYRHLAGAVDLRYELATYYNYFTGPERLRDPLVTTPYIDFSGLGHITSVCLPVYNASTLLAGVTCVDVTIKHLTSSFTQFSESEDAYVFIIDATRRTLLHPRLPQPGHRYDAVPAVISIDILEPEAHERGVIDSMVSGRTGSVTLPVLLSRGVGNATEYGVDSSNTTATFHYMPIETTNYFACLVTTAQDKRVDILETSLDPGVLYHRLDLQPAIPTCNYGGTDTVRNRSVVQLSSLAFERPEVYEQRIETPDTAEKYRLYMAGLGPPIGQHELRGGVREMVGMTRALEDIWLQARLVTAAQGRHLFAAKNGVFRVYPGSALSKQFSAGSQGWFQSSVARPSQLVLTPLHRSSLTGQPALTITQAVYGGIRTLPSSKGVVGVAGIEVSLHFLKLYIEENVPACKMANQSCILVDDIAQVLYHPSLNTSPRGSLSLARLEPDLHYSLLRRGALVRRHCSDYAWQRDYVTHALTLDAPLDDAQLFAAPVAGTNAFLLVRAEPQARYVTCDLCQGGVVDQECPEDTSQCACPCYERLRYQNCKNEFVLDRDSPRYPGCTLSASEGVEAPRGEGGGQECPREPCSAATDALACRLRICTWCEASARCEAGACTTRGNEVEKGSKQSSAVAAGVVVPLVVAATAVGVILVCLYRRGKICKGVQLRGERNPYLNAHTITNRPREPTPQIGVRGQALRQKSEPACELKGLPLSTAECTEAGNRGDGSYGYHSDSQPSSAEQLTVRRGVACKPPAVTGARPSVTQTQPTVAKDHPTEAKTQPIATQSQPSVTQAYPTLTNTQPIVTQSCSAQSQPTVTHTLPTSAQIYLTVTETPPNVTETQPTITEAHPIAEQDEPDKAHAMLSAYTEEVSMPPSDQAVPMTKFVPHEAQALDPSSLPVSSRGVEHRRQSTATLSEQQQLSQSNLALVEEDLSVTTPAPHVLPDGHYLTQAPPSDSRHAGGAGGWDALVEVEYQLKRVQLRRELLATKLEKLDLEQQQQRLHSQPATPQEKLYDAITIV